MAEAALPQFDITTFETQIFWLVVTFAIFYMFVKSKIAPYFFSEIESRDSYIENNLSEVRKLQKKANYLSDDYGEKIQAAYLRSNDVISEMKKKTAKKLDATRQELVEQAQVKLKEASNILERELSNADKGMVDEFETLLLAATRKVSIEISKERVERHMSDIFKGDK